MIDFSQPTRQSYVAIIMIIYKLYVNLIKQLWPILAIYVVGRRSSSTWDSVTYFIIVFAVIGSIFGIISFFKYYFHLEEQEVVIQKGIFQKKHINIPFERIQTVDFSQNIIHQMFNVVALKIDTAGSANTEFKFDALSREKATALRQLIFKKKAAQASDRQAMGKASPVTLREELSEESYSAPQAIPIMNLNIGRLLAVGVTENHLRSFGLIILFGFWILDSLEEFGFGWNYLEDKVDIQSVVVAGLAYAVVLIIFFLILSMILSLVRTVLQYFDLKFLRQGKGFRVVSGLFNRREIAAMDQKIQTTQWSQNLLQKGLGYYDLFLKQASSVEVVDKKSIKVPGCDLEDIKDVQSYLYNPKQLVFDNKYKVSIHWFIRPTIYITMLATVIFTVLILAQRQQQLMFFVIAYIYIIATLFLKYRKKSYQLNDSMLRLNGGTFGHSNTLMPMYKIQSVKKISNYYQRRRNLVSLNIYTASGVIGIPYIKEEMANQVRDYLLYRVEDSKRSWM